MCHLVFNLDFETHSVIILKFQLFSAMSNFALTLKHSNKSQQNFNLIQACLPFILNQTLLTLITYAKISTFLQCLNLHLIAVFKSHILVINKFNFTFT